MEDQERIIKVDIQQEMKKSYIDYSMSVIVARALPDVRDGFKPVHRRILYGMRELRNFHSSPSTRRQLGIYGPGAYGSGVGDALHFGGRPR